MQIESVAIDGLKGIHRRVEFNRPHVLVSGGVGAGKTTVWEAIRLGLGLPTRFGARGLDDLSPTGSWRVTVSVDGTRFERQGGTGGSYSRNGTRLKEAEYQDAVREVLDIQPCHLDLSAFIELSGQNRAELLSKMLESQSRSLLECIEKATGGTIQVFAEGVVGPDAKELFANWGGANPGLVYTPSEAVDHVKEAQKDLNRRHDDAESSLRNLQNSRSSTQITATKPEIERDAAKLMEAIGGLKSQIVDADRNNQTAAAATGMVTKADENIRIEALRIKNGTDELGRLRAKNQSDQEALAAKVAECARVEEAKAGHETERSRIVEAIQELKRRLDANAASGRLLAPETRVAISDSAIEDILAQGFTAGSEGWQKVRAMVPQIVQAFVDAQLGSDAGEAAEINAEIVTQESVLRVCEKQRDEAGKVEHRVWNDRELLATAIQVDKARIEDIESRLPAAERRLEEMKAGREELATKAQATVQLTDTSVLADQIEALKKSHEELMAQGRELDRLNAVAGQVQTAQVGVRALSLQLQVVKDLATRLQQWRDAEMRRSMNAIVDPFNVNLGLVMPGATVRMKSEGSGRSTVCRLLVDYPPRGSRAIEHLSAGESVLVGAAFLATLQKCKDGPGRMLTMDVETLPDPMVHKLLEAVPKLGFDFVLFTINRWPAGAVGGDTWQQVHLDAEARA